MLGRSGALLLAVLVVLPACAPLNVRGQKVAGESRPAQPGQPMITRLLLDYSPAAQKQTMDDPRFSGAALQRTMAQVLAGRRLADIANPSVVRVAAIQVEQFDVRATGNVVVMGRVASNGVLGGLVRIRDGSGAQLREFRVRAEMDLHVARSSTDDKALEILYREFARLIADELDGAVR